jgi:hypothetical protein
LWPLINEAIANRLFEQISEIEDALVERCVQLVASVGMRPKHYSTGFRIIP